MKAIYKYKINLNDGITELEIPEGAKILHSDFQAGGLFIWALVNVDKPNTKRVFKVFATGELIETTERKLQHISTYQNSQFVFHTFEILA